jgi:hypothetical protein
MVGVEVERRDLGFLRVLPIIVRSYGRAKSINDCYRRIRKKVGNSNCRKWPARSGERTTEGLPVGLRLGIGAPVATANMGSSPMKTITAGTRTDQIYKACMAKSFELVQGKDIREFFGVRHLGGCCRHLSR